MVRCGIAGRAWNSVLAFEHIFDEDAALSDFLVDNKLLIIGGDEEDHRCLR